MTIAERLEQANVRQELSSLQARCEAAAEQFRLPFNRLNWRGQAGNWAGAGIGSSIDFQDHRPYVMGDDPRYINWQAYARSGNYTMKLYREEVRPQVDLVLDLSDSMFVEPAKAIRALELFYFACYSTWRNGALLKVIFTAGGEVILPEIDSLRAGDWPLPETAANNEPGMNWQRVPWSMRSMRVIISDFLFEQDPETQLSSLARQGNQVILLSVYSGAETSPGWLGNVELLDCESSKRVRRYFTQQDIDDYRQRYEEHFARWADATARHAGCFSRISAEAEFTQQLLALSGPQGGLELCN